MIYLDAIRIKVRCDHRVENRAAQAVRTWRSPARTVHTGQTPAHTSQPGEAPRIGNSHVDRATATSPERRGQRQAVCRHAESPTDSPMVRVLSPRQAPHRRQCHYLRKSKGSLSGSSRRVAGCPAASFSPSGSGFAPARTRRPPLLVPSLAMGRLPAVESSWFRC